MVIGMFAIIEGMFSALGLFVLYLWNDDFKKNTKSVEPTDYAPSEPADPA